VSAKRKERPREPQKRWVDPDRSSSGVLLSDRICYYANEIGLIEPFTEARLAPASYDLTLGAECWYSEHAKETGQAKRMLKPGESLVIPPNSIVFVCSAETLNIPFYLVGRFNLKLRFLHEGLLVGVGPQVDPGFTGQLSCPLHNVSSEKICLTCGEGFAVIEFQKTTPFMEGVDVSTVTDEEHLRRLGEAGQLAGIMGYPCLTFPSRSLRREPVRGYLPPGKNIDSSMQGIASAVDSARTELDSTLTQFRVELNRVNLLAYVSVVTVAISIGTYFWGATNWFKGAYDSNIEIRTKMTNLEQSVVSLQERLAVADKRRSELEQNAPAHDKQAPKSVTKDNRPSTAKTTASADQP